MHDLWDDLANKALPIYYGRPYQNSINPAVPRVGVGGILPPLLSEISSPRCGGPILVIKYRLNRPKEMKWSFWLGHMIPFTAMEKKRVDGDKNVKFVAF